tara:strand:- start:170 stop:409 length:240 start_codon:yes stop_codon:yes gene_type:complete
MVMTPKDIEEYRKLEDLKIFKETGYDEFCVRFYHKTQELVLLVNGVERNRIKLDDPESKFEECLSAIKSLFISWRKLIN